MVSMASSGGAGFGGGSSLAVVDDESLGNTRVEEGFVRRRRPAAGRLLKYASAPKIAGTNGEKRFQCHLLRKRSKPEFRPAADLFT